MKKFSFVHCSDLHLGCQHLNSVERWQDFADSFAYIVDYAIQNAVDYMVIGGDFFHHRSINAPTLAQAMQLLGKLKDVGIEVIAIEGNHDKAYYLDRDSWMNFLNQTGYVKLLKPRFEEGKIFLEQYDGASGAVYETEKVRIIGLGYLGATTSERLRDLANQFESSDKFTMVLLHAGVDKLLGQDMAGVKREVFDAFIGKVDYFALGHIHNRSEIADFLYNPGAPECVHVSEDGEGKEKGFYHVAVNGREKNVLFIPAKRRAVRRMTIDLTDVAEPTQIEDIVLQYIAATDVAKTNKPLLEIVLHGMVPFKAYIVDVMRLAEKIKEKFSCLHVDIINHLNQRFSGISFEKDFSRTAIERKVLEEMLAEEKPEWAGRHREILEMILQVKSAVLLNKQPEEIIAMLGQAFDENVLNEAAVGDGGEDDENKKLAP